jgi:hypothetical protein
MSAAQAAAARLAALLPAGPRTNPGDRVAITYRGVTATGTVVGGAAGQPSNVEVRLDGTDTQIWVPATILAAVA